MSPEDKADLRGDIQRATESDQDRDAAAGIVRSKHPRTDEVRKSCGSDVNALCDSFWYLAMKMEEEIAALEKWKREAISVMPPLQEIAKFIPNLTIGDQIEDKILPTLEALTGCRDHWKTSFEHERANVIRLRSLLARAHRIMSEGGRQCDCRDCFMFRHGGEQPPKTSQAIAMGSRTCTACHREIPPPEMMTRFSEDVNLCSRCL